MARRLFALGSFDRGETGLVYDDETGAVSVVTDVDETELGGAAAGLVQADLDAHTADTTAVHGITNTANLVLTDDARLSDARAPTAHVHAGEDITSGTVADARIASTIARDSEVTTAANAAQAAAETTAAGALTTHTADTTAVHGIADTSVLETTTGSQAKVDAHTGDATAAHAASAVSADSTTLVGTGTDVQAVLEELDNGIADHLADTIAAHAATAISYGGAAGLSATDVEAALDELDTEKSATGHTHTDLVPKSLFDANTILKADSDDTPAALTMGASTILARLAAGNIVAATPAELRTLLALVIGTNVQAWDADLDAIAALTTTAYGRSLLAAADAAAARVLIGTDTLAVVGGSTNFVLASNDTSAAATTLRNLSGFVWTMVANAVYVVDLWLLFAPSAATTGLGLTFDTSVAVTFAGVTFTHQLATTGTLSGGDSIADAAASGLSSGTPRTTNTVVEGKGIVVVGANGGTCQLMWQPEVAAVATVTAKSTMSVRRVA